MWFVEVRKNHPKLDNQCKDQVSKHGGVHNDLIVQRYAGRQDYLDHVKLQAEGLVRDRSMLGEDVRAVLQRASEIWDAVVSRPSR